MVKDDTVVVHRDLTTNEDTKEGREVNSDINTMDDNYMNSIVMAHAEKTDHVLLQKGWSRD